MKSSLYERTAQTLITVLIYMAIFGVIATATAILILNLSKMSELNENKSRSASYAQEKMKQLISSQEDIFFATGVSNGKMTEIGTSIFGGEVQNCEYIIDPLAMSFSCDMKDVSSNKTLTCKKFSTKFLKRLKIDKDESIPIPLDSSLTGDLLIGFEGMKALDIGLIAYDPVNDEYRNYSLGLESNLANGFSVAPGTTSPIYAAEGFVTINALNQIIWSHSFVSTMYRNFLSSGNFLNPYMLDLTPDYIIKVNRDTMFDLWSNPGAPIQLSITPMSSDGFISIEEVSDPTGLISKVECEVLDFAGSTTEMGNTVATRVEAEILTNGTRLGIMNYGFGLYNPDPAIRVTLDK